MEASHSSENKKMGIRTTHITKTPTNCTMADGTTEMTLALPPKKSAFCPHGEFIGFAWVYGKGGWNGGKRLFP